MTGPGGPHRHLVVGNENKAQVKLSSLFIFFPLALAPLFGFLGDRFGFLALYLGLTLLMAGGSLVVLNGRRHAQPETAAVKK